MTLTCTSTPGILPDVSKLDTFEISRLPRSGHARAPSSVVKLNKSRIEEHNKLPRCCGHA
jgi:hypothetical protein